MDEGLGVINNHTGNWYVLVAGLPRVPKPLLLAQGLSLRPLSQPLTVFDLAATGAAGFREWAVLEPILPACTCEIESAREFDIPPGYDTLNRAWLLSSLLVLRGFTKQLGLACSAYSWNEIAGHQERTAHVFGQQLLEEGPEAAVHKSKRELPKFIGQLLDYRLKIIVNDQSRADAINEDDCSWISTRFDTANRLAAENTAFRFALEAAVDWRYAKDSRSAVSRLWSGIEAIFGISSELVYRISILSASLLTSRGKLRREKFAQVKKLYGLRSKVVHGANIPDQQVRLALNGSYRLLVDLLTVTIESGHALTQEDFDSALFD